MKKSIMNFNSEIIINPDSTVWFADRAGIQYQVSAGRHNRRLAITPRLQKAGTGRWFLSATIRNITRQPLFLNQIALLDTTAANDGYLDLGGLPTAWTAAVTSLGQRKIIDLCIERHEHYKSDCVSGDYMALGNRHTKRHATFGYLTFNKYPGALHLQFDAKTCNFEYFRAICELDGYRLDPGEKLQTETLYINLADTPAVALDDYTTRTAERFTRTLPMKPITGWATWDYYLSKISEDDVLENARWLARRRNELPIDFIQIDHGFQRCEGDWLVTNERFPHGLKWLAAEISKLGFKPAIWLCPFLIDPDSRVYHDHPEWVFRDKHSKPVRLNGYTNRSVYGLDCSIPAARKWVRELGRAVTRDYGFKYVKLDGANGQIMARNAVPADPKFTKSQAARMGLAAFRQGIGDDTVLLSAFLPGMSGGIVDAMRIGGDIGARWDATHIDKHHGERDNYPGPGFIARGVDAAMNLFYLHHRWWINDPDYLVVRPKGDRSELTLEEARTWVTTVGLTNGLLMLSDRMTKLPAARVKLLEKVLPAYTTGARTVDYFETEYPVFMHLPVTQQAGDRHVIGIINTKRPERTRDFTLALEKIGLDAGRQYLVFDFWNKRFLGVISSELKISSLPSRHCRVLGLCAVAPYPQLLATDMHLTMGGVEIKSARFNAKTGVMRIVPAPIHRQGQLFIHVPAGWRVKSPALRVKNNIAVIPVKFTGKRTPIEIKFQSR